MVQTNAQERFELWNKSDIAEIGGRVEQIPVTAPFQETLRVFKRDGIVVLNDAVSLDVVTGIVDEFNSMMAMTDMEHHFRDKLDSKSGKSILGVLTKRRSEILARSPHLVGQLLTQPFFEFLLRIIHPMLEFEFFALFLFPYLLRIH